MKNKLEEFDSKNRIWGKHLLIDAYNIERKKLRDRQALRKLLKDLPKKFGMRILGKPLVFKVASKNLKYSNWGLSGFAMLLESHVSFHTWPEEGYVAMDIFSCKDFNHKTVIDYIKKFWKSEKTIIKVIIRGQKKR